MTPNKEKFRKLIEQKDWSGMAKAFAQQDVDFHAAEWQEFITLLHESWKREAVDKLEKLKKNRRSYEYETHDGGCHTHIPCGKFEGCCCDEINQTLSEAIHIIEKS